MKEEEEEENEERRRKGYRLPNGCAKMTKIKELQ